MEKLQSLLDSKELKEARARDLIQLSDSQKLLECSPGSPGDQEKELEKQIA